MLEKENITLDKLNEKLEISLGRGEYNPETTRVNFFILFSFVILYIYIYNFISNYFYYNYRYYNLLRIQN